MRRRLFRLLIVLLATFVTWMAVLLSVSALIFDDPWHDYDWWQIFILSIGAFGFGEFIAKPVESWIKKEKK